MGYVRIDGNFLLPKSRPFARLFQILLFPPPILPSSSILSFSISPFSLYTSPPLHPPLPSIKPSPQHPPPPLSGPTSPPHPSPAPVSAQSLPPAPLARPAASTPSSACSHPRSVFGRRPSPCARGPRGRIRGLLLRRGASARRGSARPGWRRGRGIVVDVEVVDYVRGSWVIVVDGERRGRR